MADVAAGELQAAAPQYMYDVIPVSEKPFRSLPLFLPSNVTYDPSTNTASAPAHHDDNHDDEELVLVPNAGYDLLRSVNKPISCVSMVGPYRSGKSLLLSRFLKNSSTFTVGPTLEGCTRGIWISTSAIVRTKQNGDNGNDNGGGDEEECYTFLLDCEGTGDVLEGSDTSNARIALTCILLSSTFVFNVTGRPDRTSLQFLSYLETVRQRLPQHGLGGCRQQHFPAFLWVFRDFFLQLPLRKDEGRGGRQQPARPYTLREYMLERVLVSQSSPTKGATKKGGGGKKAKGGSDSADDAIIDSILTDFKSFDVLSIPYPRRSDDVPFSPEELSTLDAIPWTDFSSDFRRDVENVIAHALAHATPFRLGGDDGGDDGTADKNDGGGDGSGDGGIVAHGPLFASWCSKVLELVNDDEVIPDLPDLQHQLVQKLAEESVERCVEQYAREMARYLNLCPVVNKVNDGLEIADAGTTIDLDNLDLDGCGVAEEVDLLAKSTVLLEGLCKTLRRDITASPALLDNAVDRLQSRCAAMDDDDGGASQSVYARLQTANADRSRTVCDILARSMYGTFRTVVRDDATSMMTEGEFESGIRNVEARFRQMARGPAVDHTVSTFLAEQVEADRVFLARVNGINALYKETLVIKEKLDRDVVEKEAMVHTLEQDLEDSNVRHRDEVQRISDESREQVERLNANHVRAMDDAIARQKDLEAAHVAKVQGDADAKLRRAEKERLAELQRKKDEMDALKTDAERRLADEIEAREERFRKEEEAHRDAIQKLLLKADEKMAAEINAAEDKRQKDQVKFQTEMDSKLKDAEDRMNEEVRRREERLREEERKHKEELERVRRELNDKREKEKQEYLAEIDKLEKQCLKCCMM